LQWLSRHWFPALPVDENSMGAALWMEKRHFEQMTNAVAAGIAKAFN